MFSPFYSFTRKLLVAVVDKWDSHVLVVDKVVPPNWKVCFPAFYCMTCLGFTSLAWFSMLKKCNTYWVATLVKEDLSSRLTSCFSGQSPLTMSTFIPIFTAM